jgi:NiFe hydrogenase small subunit HydA
MEITRRDFMTAASAIAAAFGCRPWEEARGATLSAATGLPPVVWLQGQTCSGCSVSLLNSIALLSAADLLTKTVALSYHSTLMSAYGNDAVAAAKAAQNTTGFVLVVEGAIPTASQGKQCYLWPGTTAVQGVKDFASRAAFVIAAGTCASFGGVAAGSPNPTAARSLGAVVGTARVVNVPGCPTHPDWLVGTIAYLLKYGQAPALDGHRRPVMYFKSKVHDLCPYREDDHNLCLEDQGCRGKQTRGDCPARRWNSPGAATPGVNWCVLARSPCHGCTEPTFPDGMSPFYKEDDEGDD